MAVLQVKGGVFLTYPQFVTAAEVAQGTTINKEDVKSSLLDNLKSYFDDKRIASCPAGVVAVEKHEDGALHLHVFLQLKLGEGKKMIRIKHSDLDLSGRHGNYQAAKSDAAVSKYCVKEGDYIWWGVDPALRAEVRGMKRSLVLAEVIAGTKSVEDAVVANPLLLVNYSQLVKNLEQLRATQLAKSARRDPKLVLLTGPAGAGKTSLAMSLVESPEDLFFVPLPSRPGQPWWFDGYRGQRVLVFDNVSKETSPPYDLMCRLVDRSLCQVPTKGGHVLCSPDVVVVTSTAGPAEIWSGLWDMQLARRLTVYKEAAFHRVRVPFSELEPQKTIVWRDVDVAQWKVPPATLEMERQKVLLRAAVGLGVSSSAAATVGLVSSNQTMTMSESVGSLLLPDSPQPLPEHITADVNMN